MKPKTKNTIALSVELFLFVGMLYFTAWFMKLDNDEWYMAPTFVVLVLVMCGIFLALVNTITARIHF